MDDLQKDLQAGLAIPELSIDSIRRKGTLVKSLPPIDNYGAEKLYTANWKAIDAAEYAQAIKAATNETKAYNRRSRAIARAKGRQMQRAAER